MGTSSRDDSCREGEGVRGGMCSIVFGLNHQWALIRVKLTQNPSVS